MMNEPSRAVFLSYASQDAEAAKRIADALRAAGIEVWFDQNELVGGDAWDAKIRGQIASCALFVPIISANTQARREGYFRLEWRIAAQRTHMMSEQVAFLLPLVVDETRDTAADVPAEFKSVQWTRLPAGEASAAFCARVRKLLQEGAGPETNQPGTVTPAAPATSASPRSRWVGYGWAVVGIGIGLFYALRPMWHSPRTRNEPPPAVAAPTEAQLMLRQAKALIDQEPLTTRETFRTAAELGEKAAALSPHEADIWATLARANSELVGQYHEGGEARIAASRSQAERALQLAPDSVEAGLAMATVELDFLDVDPRQVRQRLETLLHRAPEDHRILLLLSQTEDANVVSETAFRWLAQAEALPGGKARAALRQAWIYWGANRLRDSLAAVERSLAVQPLTEAYHLKLMLLRVTGDTAGALAWLKQIPPVVLREDRPAIIAYETFYCDHKPEEALRVLKAVPREVFEEARYFEVRSLLAGEALLMAGKPRAAEVEFRAALKVIDERLATNPQHNRHSRLWHAKGRAQFHLGDRTAAEDSFLTAREFGGNSDSMTAIQHQLLGQTEEALDRIELALDRKRTRWPAALQLFKSHPVFDPLRDNARFRQLIARADAWLAEELRPPETAKPPTAPMPAELAAAKSVAVLAFANLSDDKANEYFSDGISEELLNVLAKVPGLTVRGRSSGFYFKGQQVQSAEIGRQLAVDYLVQGSVRRAGDRVRISAQLIRAANDQVLWSSGALDRDLKDIFAVQDEIARLIAQNLQLKLGDGRAAAKAVNPEAHRLVLEGRHYLALRGEANFARSEAAFRTAAEIAPDLAVAHAGRAELVAQRGRYQQMAGLAAPGAQLEEVQRHATRALQLDPSLSEPHAALAVALVDAGHLAEADVETGRGIAANPNYGSQYLWRSHLHIAREGRLDRALVDLQRATDLDPLAFIHLYIQGAHLGYAGRWAEALPLLDRGAALRGERFLPLEGERALARFQTGRREEAMTLARSILADPEVLTLGWWSLGEVLWILRQGGAEEEAGRQGEAILAQLAPDNYLRGYVLCGLGRFEEGLPLLRHIPTVARNRLYFVPIFDPARDTPAFRRLITEMKVETEYALARATRARLLEEPNAKK